MNRRRIVLAVVVSLSLIVILSGLAEAATSSWSKKNSTGQAQPGVTWAYTRAAVPSKDTYGGTNPGMTGIYIWDEGSTVGRILRQSTVGIIRFTELFPAQTMGYPTPREGACLVWSGSNWEDFGHQNHGQDLILFGGRIATGQYTNEVNVYNIVNNTWEYRGFGPLPGRAFAQCGRFSSFNAVSYEWNGMFVFGGMNSVQTLSDGWIFCDHPSWNPQEFDELGCARYTHAWRQVSWDASCTAGNRIMRDHAAFSEVKWSVLPHNIEDTQYILWGGIRNTQWAARDPTFVYWVGNPNGLLTFACTGFSESNPVSQRHGSGVGFVSTWGGTQYNMILYGGYRIEGEDTQDVVLILFNLYSGIASYGVVAQTGTKPTARQYSAFACRDWGPDASGYGLGCIYTTGQPYGTETYLMHAGTNVGGTKFSDTWTYWVSSP